MRAQDLYDQYRVAVAKVDAYERRALDQVGGDPVMAVGLLLSDRINPRPEYKTLTGAKDGLYAQLNAELGMAAMYARLTDHPMARVQVQTLYRRMHKYRP